jgi:arylsulfatase A-like enzyme
MQAPPNIFLNGLGLVCGAAFLALSATAAPAKPNLIFLFTDDQSADTVAAAKRWGVDATQIHTPHMDRLVADGTSFSHAYNMGSWHPAVCIASRAMLNTGRFLWHAKAAHVGEYQQTIPKRGFWSQRLEDAGYDTYMSGKWHVYTPVDVLFKHLSHVRAGMPETVPSAYHRPVESEEDPWLPWDTRIGGFWQGGKHWSEVLADDAEAFIDRAAKSEKPFFMYLSFNAPHDPRQSPREFVGMYPLEKIALPQNFLPRNPHHEAMGIGPADRDGLRDEILAPFPRSEFAVKTHLREYRAIVSHLDAQIGRILDAVERAGLADNTFIVLTSDNGLSVGRHGLMGKQSLYEHALRVPFIIRGPGIPRGKALDTPIYLQDAVPTTLELAGAKTDQIDFRSVLPLIRGEREHQYPAIYAAFDDKAQRAVIDGGHKLILYPEAKLALLFDLAADPLEMNDLASRADSLPVKKRLFARLLELQKETGDPLDLTAFYPDLSS